MRHLSDPQCHQFVAEGSNRDIVDGAAVAREGDTVECKEHGTQTLAEGDEAGMVSGSPVALLGHRMTRGCTLVSQGTTIGVV